MTTLVSQPTKAPMRKVAVTAGLGSLASAIFAAAPAISAAIPGVGPLIAAAQVLVPIALPQVAYRTKEWGGTEQASSAPLRKVTIMATVGQVAAIVFAAQPQLVAALPQLGPFIDAAKVLLPALLGPLGYSVKEWTPAPEPIAGPLPAFKRA